MAILNIKADIFSFFNFFVSISFLYSDSNYPHSEFKFLGYFPGLLFISGKEAPQR